MKKTSGSCLCNKVTIFIDEKTTKIGACHCKMCRKWTSGPLMALAGGEEVEFSGKEYIKVYRSSKWAERAFCSECGSSLFYRLLNGNKHYISVALFGDEHDFELTGEIFIDHKPDYYNFLSATSHKKTEAEM